MDRPTPVELRKECWKRRGKLFGDAQQFFTRCKDVTDYILPYAGRYFAQDKNRADARFGRIFDTHASWCLDTLTSGMESWASPQTGKWHGLTVDDPGLAEDQETVKWLAQLQKRQDHWIKRSNFYRVQSGVYREAGAFGMAACIVEPHPTRLFWMHPVTVGEFACAADENDKVDTFYREFALTVRQCVQKFGLEQCSSEIQRRYKLKEFDHPVTILHVIEPRHERDGESESNLDMPWRSIYMECSEGTAYEGLLSESGYQHFPVLVPRWQVLNGEVYGYGPGVIALSHVKALQQRALRMSQVVDSLARPPMVLPGSLRGMEHRMLPGQHLYHDSPHPNAVYPAFEQKGNVQHLGAEIADVRRQIERVFFVDAFLMFTRTEIKSATTLGEIEARRAEQFSMLGPQSARLFEEFHRQLVDIVTQYMGDRDLIPAMPDRLLEYVRDHGGEPDVEFESVLAKAQRAQGLGGLMQYAEIGMALTKGGIPGAAHKINGFKVMDEVARMTGVDPAVVNDDDAAQAMADAEAQALAAANQAEIRNTEADTQAKLSKAEATPTNALGGILQMVGGGA